MVQLVAVYEVVHLFDCDEWMVDQKERDLDASDILAAHKSVLLTRPVPLPIQQQSLSCRGL